jgi:hypothetical protein
MDQQSMHWTEAWLRTRSNCWRPRLRGLVGHRQPANIISEEAVLIGVTATLGLAAVVAFMTGLGQVLVRALGHIGGQVP